METMRDDFEAAIDKLDGEEENVEETIEHEASEAPETQASEEEAPPADNEDGGGGADTLPEPAELEGGIEATKNENTAADPSHTSIKAPVNWGAKEREDWSKIPRHLQEKIMSREQDMQNTMQTTADARKTQTQFDKLGQNYASLLASEGVSDPMQAVEGLFQTTATLKMGSEQDKARKIADMINHYGVDISALDAMLVGNEPSAGQAQNTQFEQMLDQRMAPVNQLLGQMQAQEQQTHQDNITQATSAVAEFSKNAEFLNDVRHDMADLVDMAHARGQTMDLKDAYDKACALNPQVSSVIAQRASDAALMGSQNTIAGKRNAASSLNGKRSGTGGSGGAMSLRDSLDAAWDESAGR